MKPDVLLTPFKQLVERRLWPLAVLLVAALVAVPFLLAQGDEATAPSSVVAAAGGAEQGETQPIVSAQDAGAHDSVRKVLGSPKNPFRPAIAAKKGKPASTAAPSVAGGADKVDTSSSGSGSSAAGGSGSTGSTGGAPASTPVPTVPAEPKEHYEMHSLIVRFGSTSGELLTRPLKRLKGLPGGAPKLVYLGLLEDHKTAVFLVDASAKVQGDGRCEPTPADCQRLLMRAGDTVFVDVGQGDAVKQYELDVVKVITRKTTREDEAIAARVSVAKHGRKVLRKNLGRVGRYRYSSSAGALKVLPKK